MFVSAAAAPIGQAADPVPIKDKTLVVWTAPANLSQKAGGALTIENPGGVFDSIVFGELHAKKWMPGSNVWSRTEKGQADWPAETADAKTLVQIAIVYRGKQVTIYRNTKKYAEYTMKPNPMTFSTGSVVLMGIRHLDAGHPRYYAGSIEDARIYNVALDAAALAAMKPNEPSEPKPIGWWDFQTGKVEDKMKTFPEGKLVAGAKIADGRLHLDGRDDVAVIGKAAVRRVIGGSDVTDLGQAINNSRDFREHLLKDPYRPGYHFVIPEGRGMPFDPNGAIFWKGRYHLFYIFQDKRGHNWGHVSSTDLFHWRHHPTRLLSNMFSGNCFVNKDGRPTMCYHHTGKGNAMAVSLDDELNEWEKLASNPITPQTKPGDKHHGKYSSWDPYGWLEDDTYYAIFGGKRPAIAKSKSLAGPWTYSGDLLANTVGGISINEDVSCADFFKIGDKRMLLCISHRLGARYYLGTWKNEQFHPTFHEKMSWVDNSYFAPESLLDDKGRRIMWAWIFDRPQFKTRMDHGWSGTMGLPRVLSLGKDGMLRMNVPVEIEKLRYNGKKLTDLSVKADSELAVEGIGGNSLELAIEIDAKDAKQFGVKVCCSPGGEEQTVVYYDAAEKKLKIDTHKSSLTEGSKSIEAGPFQLKGDEPLTLRVFVDKSVVEVFANDRQAVMRRVYPSRKDSVGVKLFSNGGPARVTTLEAWQMMESNPY